MYYKAPDNSLHFLSAQDIASGGEGYLPHGCIKITEKQAEEIRTANAQKPTADQLCAERDCRLAACDWTQLADAPLTSAQKTAWKAYRQALRDVPGQSGFPESMAWPTTPQ